MFNKVVWSLRFLAQPLLMSAAVFFDGKGVSVLSVDHILDSNWRNFGSIRFMPRSILTLKYIHGIFV